MRIQRNISEMKEQNQTPEKELKKMEINTLSDAELKTLVIRMTRNSSFLPSGTHWVVNSIKQTQVEIKIIPGEIKENL